MPKDEKFSRRLTLMLRYGQIVLLSTALYLSSSAIARAAQTAPSNSKTSQWSLVWSDEFNNPKLDTSKWVYEIGGGKWGNQELEFYTNQPSNLSIQNGNLTIVARPEKRTDSNKKTWNYTSARIKTFGKFAQTYGRFEARIKVPFGQGIWPAFWMLGANIEKVDWPNCGEIDIMENIGKEPGIVHGTIHGPGYSGAGGIGDSYTLPHGQRFADDFHVFAVEWEPQAIRFYVDNDLYATRTPADLPSGKKWVYDHPFFLLLNLAVGGDWPGNPDASTVLPQTMLVDYVRVYSQKKH
jgi:beta-glucanase (GH16 family)